MKTELEEAAENHLQKWRLLNNIHLSNVLHAERCKNDFTAGAKWQAERMYSEEDMHKAYCAGSDFDMSCLKGEQYYMFKEWFEQFKKK